MAAWTQIAHASAPASGVFELASLSLAAYPVVVLFLSGIVVDTDGADVLARCMVAGVAITAASHRYVVDSHSHSGTDNTTQSAIATSLPFHSLSAAPDFGIGNAAGESFAGMMEVFNPAVSGPFKPVRWRSAHILPSGNKAMTIGAGAFPTTGVIDGFRIIPSAGAITSGKVTLLGMGTS